MSVASPIRSQSPIRFPDVTRWVLPNGLVVLYRRSPGMPLAAASVLVRTGSYYERANEAGLASFTLDLLLQGTRRRSATAIANEMEFMGASLGIQGAEDYAEAGFVAPSAQLERALDVVSDILRQPSFPAEEVRKERSHILAGLASRTDSIFNVAHDRFEALLYGDHPYGRPSEGTVKTVKRFHRQQFQRWHAEHVRPDRVIFSLVAPHSLRDIQRLMSAYFGPWKLPATPFREPLLPPAPELTASQRDRVAGKFEQAYLMTGMLAPAASDDGFVPLKVLNTLLGGGMSSRLFLQLREELGLAYEVSSFFPTRLHSSQWVIYMGLPAERLELAEEKLEGLLKELRRNPPSDEEVRQAKQMIRGAFLMEHQTRRRQGWYSAWWEFLGKGWDYDREYLQAIDQVTPEAIQAIAERLFSRPRVTVAVVPG